MNITIILANGGVMANDSKVVQADIDCTNGVILAIDTVLMPGCRRISSACALF